MSAGNLKVPVTEVTCNSIKAKANHSDTYAESQSVLEEFEKLYKITAKINTGKGYVDMGTGGQP